MTLWAKQNNIDIPGAPWHHCTNLSEGFPVEEGKFPEENCNLWR